MATGSEGRYCWLQCLASAEPGFGLPSADAVCKSTLFWGVCVLLFDPMFCRNSKARIARSGVLTYCVPGHSDRLYLVFEI